MPSKHSLAFNKLLAATFLLSFLGACFYVGYKNIYPALIEKINPHYTLTREHLAHILSQEMNATGEVPSSITLPVYENHEEPEQVVNIHNTLNPQFNEWLEIYMNRYKPDYGAIAVMNPDTGAILALSSYVRDGEEAAELGHLALKAPFPAASIIKIVTAAAAIDEGKAVPNTVIPFNGRNHTLFKRNVKSNETNRWTRRVTLQEAFGRSINTAFGRLGLFQLGTDRMWNYAEAFYFNRDIPTELEVESSAFVMDPDDSWQLVENASGYTRRTTLSPLHGAMIASALINDGKLYRPYLVNSATNQEGETLYQRQPELLAQVISAESARKMHSLMEETILRGTSRGAFRTFRYRNSESLMLGGKTGSLTGNTLRGRTDWFVGYVSHEGQRLAVGIVTVHKKYWTVRSSTLASLFFQRAIQEQRANDRVTAAR